MSWLIVFPAVAAASLAVQMVLFRYLKKHHNETWRLLGEPWAFWRPAKDLSQRAWFHPLAMRQRVGRWFRAGVVWNGLMILLLGSIYFLVVFLAIGGWSPEHAPARSAVVSHTGRVSHQTVSMALLHWIGGGSFFLSANVWVFIRSYMKRRHGEIWNSVDRFVGGGPGDVRFLASTRDRRLGDQLLNELFVVHRALFLIFASTLIGRLLWAWGLIR